MAPEGQDGQAIVGLAHKGEGRVVHQDGSLQVPAQAREVLRGSQSM